MMPNSFDAIDRRILGGLQRDGRMTNQDLATMAGLSPSPCLRRLRRLEREGVILNYVALLDPDRLGLSVTAFVRIRLERQDEEHLDEFERAVTGFPEVMECYLMSGEADYQLRVLVGSLSDYERFLRDRLTKLKGVSEVTTSFALRPVVYKTELPLGE
jgi:Lrp/AsnC family leucine-responsive transcriptional regulator